MPALLLLLLVAAHAHAAQVPWPQEPAPRDGDPRLTAILAGIQGEHHVPALAAGVVRGGTLVAAGVVGWRKLGDPTPATVADQWHLGSDTKAMTATVAARLVERGALRWDSTVAEVLPGVPAAWTAVTLDQLLAHRAGAPENVPWRLQPDRTAAVHAITATPPSAPPGTAYRYSNAGYVLAAAMLERRTGRTWEQLVAEELWRPLGIAGAGFGGMGRPGAVDQPWGHQPGGVVLGNGPAADNPPVMGPAGTVHLPLAGWARFIADQLHGARGEPALLAAESYRHLHQPWPGGDYARGWIVVQPEGAKDAVLTHSGSNTMHYAVALMAPGLDLGIMVCCNQGDAEAACDAVIGALLPLFPPP